MTISEEQTKSYNLSYIKIFKKYTTEIYYRNILQKYTTEIYYRNILMKYTTEITLKYHAA